MIRARKLLTGLGCVLACQAFLPAWAVSAPAPAAKTKPYVQWSAIEEPATNQLHQPLVVKDKVVLGTDNGELRAYRISDGKLDWKYESGHRIFDQPSSDGERIFFAHDGSLIAVTADTGVKVWDFALAGSSSGPTYASHEKRLVYTADCNGKLYALDAKTGAKRWDSDFLADAPPDPPGFDGGRARIDGTKARPSALASDGDGVFLSVFDQCRVIAFDATTGKRRWAFQTRGWSYGPAVVTATSVLVGSQDRRLYCLDKKTGEQVWKFASNGLVQSAGSIDKRFVYFASLNGRLYCLNLADGKLQWRMDVDPAPSDGRRRINSEPFLHDGVLHFTAGGGWVYAIDAADGTPRWKLQPYEKSESYCRPVTDGKSYFVVTEHGRDQVPPAGVTSLLRISVK